MTDTNTHGGKRAGAGRKPRYGVPTVRLSVPAPLLLEVMAMILAFKPDDPPLKQPDLGLDY